MRVSRALGILRGGLWLELSVNRNLACPFPWLQMLFSLSGPAIKTVKSRTRHKFEVLFKFQFSRF